MPDGDKTRILRIDEARSSYAETMGADAAEKSRMRSLVVRAPALSRTLAI